MTSSPPNPPELKEGSLAAAIENGRQLLKRNPALALAQAHAILRRDARNPDALRLAAAAHRLRGEELDAQRAELTAIQHGQSDPALNAAALALDEGKPAEANRIVSGHLRSSPDDLAARTLLAETALAAGLPEKAEPILRLVLERAPQFQPAEDLLVSSLLPQDKLSEARERLEARNSSGRASLSDMRLLARVQSDVGDHEASAATCERMLEMDDQSIETWTSYGDTLRFLGRKVESRLAYQRALGIDPGSGQAWWSLVSLDPEAISDPDLVAMERALEGDACKSDDIGNLNFALGEAFDSRKQFERAFHHFETGNRLRKAAQPYDPGRLTEYVDECVRLIDEGALDLSGSPDSGSGSVVFIVGMPRSGSSLVERMLGRHSSIEALGEMHIVPHIVRSLKVNDPETPAAARIARLSRAQLRDRAGDYMARTAERRRTDRPIFTDKLHMNWKHLPLILRMLPDARIIDVRRSALDCCWSNFKMPFGRGHPAASSLEWIGRFYRDYVRLMDSIDRLAPDRVLRVRYEDLVDDLEGHAERILDYIGLPFEAECLEFHLSSAPVATASSEQVRRPLNREGIGAWKPYSEWLAPLRETLGPLAAG